MSFMNPWAFWLLVPVAVLALLGSYRGARQNSPLHRKIVLDETKRSRLKVVQIAALALMVVALARPVVKSHSVAEHPRYAPIYLALDLSASMRATDRRPSRLEYSKEIIRELLKRDTSHPFGLFGFTSNTLILSPATMDHTLVATALESINPDFIISHATSLKSLLESAAKLPEKGKRLVVFSDGGDEHDIVRMLQICREGGITIYAVEAAAKSGSPIPERDGGFVRDEKGRLVISMQNPSFAQLARLSGGAVIDAEDAREAAAELESAFADDDLKAEASVEVSVTEFFWIPLLFAFILFFIGVVRVPESLRIKGVAVILALLGMQSADASVTELWTLHEAYEAYEKGDYNGTLMLLRDPKESSLQKSFAKASALYRLGAYKRAARTLLGIKSDDAAVKAAIYYDLGNCAVKLGRFRSARGYYVKSLQLHPDKKALENLAAILFKKERKEGSGPKAAAKTQKAPGGAKNGENGGSSGKRAESKSSGGGQSGSGEAKSGSRPAAAVSKSSTLKHPLGSKAYELINKGYLDERRPW